MKKYSYSVSYWTEKGDLKEMNVKIPATIPSEESSRAVVNVILSMQRDNNICEIENVEYLGEVEDDAPFSTFATEYKAKPPVIQNLSWQIPFATYNIYDVCERYSDLYGKECPYTVATAKAVAERAADILEKDEGFWNSFWYSLELSIKEQESGNNA